MASFIDPFSYLPQTVDIGGDIYSLGTEKPVNLGFKSRKQFLDTFGTNSKTEGLLRKYMNLSVKGKNKLVFDSPEDKTDLIEILKKRSTVLKNSKGFTKSILKNEIFKRSYLYIQKLITDLEGSNSKSIKVDDEACATAKKQIKDIKDDHKFQIILEMAWYLLHPDDVPSDVGCEWAKMIKQLDTLRIGDIVTEIREAPTKSGIEPSKNAFNYFKKINLQTVAKSETIKNALDQAKKFATDIQGETASQDVKNRLKLLLDILEMKKYLANDLPVDEDRMKIISSDESNTIKRSMITNPMKGGALALNQPLGKAMMPLFDYFKVVYDPIYTFLEESIKKYRAKNENKIIIPQLTTLLHICNNLNPENIETNKFITYRITNVDPELLKFIKAMIGATNGKIDSYNNSDDKNKFNNQLLKLPKVRLSSISDKAFTTRNEIYKDPYKLSSIRFFTMKENIEYQPKGVLSDEIYNGVTDFFTEKNIYIVYTNSENITSDIPINLYDIDYSKIDITNKIVIISPPTDNYLVKNKESIEGKIYFENLIKIKEYSLYNDAELALSIFIALKELMPQ